jgi:RNA polymerase sigma-70 factor (ECF subfamily)
MRTWVVRPADDELGRVLGIVDSVLRRVLGGARDPDYEDLVQSALEQVLATLEKGSFRGDCGLDAWAASIARNVAVDALRARTRDRRVFVRDEDDDDRPEVPAPGHAPEHRIELGRQLRQLAGALSQLRPAKARVVYLHDVLGYDLAEIAATIGTSVAAAQSRLVRGRREIVGSMKPAAALGARRARRHAMVRS